MRLTSGWVRVRGPRAVVFAFSYGLVLLMAGAIALDRSTEWRGGFTAISVVIFAALALHEVGHAVRARQLGCVVSELRVGVLTSATAYTDPAARSHWSIALAGPIANVLAAAVAVPLLASSGNPQAFARGWIAVNLAVAILNLVPLPGSDGLMLVRGGRSSGRRAGRSAGVS